MSSLRLKASIDLLGLADEGVERAGPGAAPTAFRIWRAGENPTDHGQTVFTKKSAELLEAAQVVRGNLVSIDVDHLSLNEKAPPEARKAVGWHRLEVRRDVSGAPELWASDVQWTDAVRAGLEKQPPEWRYFSPAYDVDKETREVTAYLNTALTNNPATWQVTALASRAAQQETDMDEKLKEALATLKAAAEGDDEEAKKCARAMAAYEKDAEGEGDEPPPNKEGDDDGKKEPPPKKDSDDDADKKDTAAVAASAAKLVAEHDEELRRVKAELATFAKERDDAERTRILAGREMSDDLRKKLSTKPLALVREIVEALPLKAQKDPAASERVTATRGAGQGGKGEADRTPQLPPDQRAQLNERMGITSRRDAIRREGTDVVFGVMGSADARRHLAAKNAKGTEAAK